MMSTPKVTEHLVTRAALQLAYGMPLWKSPYYGIEDIVLDRGVQTSVKRLSKDQVSYVKHVMELAGGNFPQKQCFANALLAIKNDVDGRLSYMEGFSCGLSIVVHHAWLTIEGAPVELTFREGSVPIIQPGLKFEYFGIPFTRNFVGRFPKEEFGGLLLDNSVAKTLANNRIYPVSDEVQALASQFNRVRTRADR